MYKFALVMLLAYTPTIIKDVEDIQEHSAILVLNDYVPNKKSTCFIPMSETRKVHLKLLPIGTDEQTKKFKVIWTTDVDPLRFKDAVINIFQK